MTDWTRAACLDADPTLFHLPGDGTRWHDPANATQLAEARAVCATCPALVRDACLAEAIAQGDTFSFRGGTTPTERDALVKRARTRRKPTGRAVAKCPAGHDTSHPDARYADRSCKQCKRERREKRRAA